MHIASQTLSKVVICCWAKISYTIKQAYFLTSFLTDMVFKFSLRWRPFPGSSRHVWNSWWTFGVSVGTASIEGHRFAGPRLFRLWRPAEVTRRIQHLVFRGSRGVPPKTWKGIFVFLFFKDWRSSWSVLIQFDTDIYILSK